MSLEPGLIGYAAMACFALSQKKHRPAPPMRLMPSPTVARRIGLLLLFASAMVALIRQGIAAGPVLWIGGLSVGGAILVLLMSWQRRIAISLGVWSLLAALALSLGS